MSDLRRTSFALALAVCTGVLARPHGAQAATGDPCRVFSPSDAAKALKGPVKRIVSADTTDCSYELVKRGVGVTIHRDPDRGDWYPPKPGTTSVSRIVHVSGVGENAYTYYANSGYGGVYTADVLGAKGTTSVSVSEGAGDAKTALAIARTVMNR